MQKTSIGLIAAMPEEIQPLLKVAGKFRKERTGRQTIYWLSIANHTVCLVESGMGPRNAADATSRLIELCSPAIILNFGFAGALTPELKVGDLVAADRLLFFHEGLFSEQRVAPLVPENAGEQLQTAAFVTTSAITDKKQLAERLPAGIRQAVVEMETCAVAKVAASAGIPFMAIRAISDATDEELGFTLDEFCDRELKLKIWRVMLSVARKPWIIPQLIRLAGNSKTAGIRLANFLNGNLKLLVQP